MKHTITMRLHEDPKDVIIGEGSNFSKAAISLMQKVDDLYDGNNLSNEFQDSLMLYLCDLEEKRESTRFDFGTPEANYTLTLEEIDHE